MAYTQENRTFRLDTTLGGETTLLERFEGREGISEPFRLIVRFLTVKPIDMDGLLGKAASVTTQKDFADRQVLCHGHFWIIRQLAEGHDGLFAYEAELVPWLKFLELHRHCRIFHKSSVEEIVSTIFSDRGLIHYRFDLQSPLAKREYCVQYRETDLNFVSRLLEEEGIFYFFQPAEDKHELVLTDKKVGLPPCPGGANSQYHPLVGGAGISNSVFKVESRRQMHAGGVAFNDYNYETPKVSLSATLGSSPIGVLFDYPGRYGTKSDGDRYARIRLEEQEVQFTGVTGAGSCAGFRSGHTFQLAGHSQRDLNKQYLLFRIEHRGQNQSYRADEVSKGAEYQNVFHAIPAAVQYRPPRSSKRAIVHGTQTAVVTGPQGQEIYTDKYGRIQVRFFWTDGAESDSCWVRVAQTWAGKNWGAVTIPRVGQEVVVDFLEGDPDRPLVIGSVYNADQTPPYDLLANKTRSGIRSHSSTGGAVSNCNEIYFEDQMGQEVLFVQAERDNLVNVKHDRAKKIGNDETISVGHNRSASVSGNDSLSVASDRSATISNNDAIKVGAKFSIVAGEEIKLSGPGGSITIGAEGITIQSPMLVVIQGEMVKIN